MAGTDQNPQTASPSIGTPANLNPEPAYKYRRTLPTAISGHAIPDVHKSSIIIGVCGVDLGNADPTDGGDGLFLADFCAFNALLKGLGASQTSISAVSEQSLLKYFQDHPELAPGYLHGNPHQERRVVFSEEVVSRGLLTPFTVEEPTKVTSTLLEKLQSACNLALQSTPSNPVLVLLFGHGIEDLDLCLDYTKTDRQGGLISSLTLGDFQASIDPAVSVTVLTTACFSGGWAVYPDLNATVLTAAARPPACLLDSQGKEPWLSQSSDKSPGIGRFCGSMFATSIIETLSNSASPLLELPSAIEDAAGSATCAALQPENPTEEQSETYNEFCRAVVRTLRESFTRRNSQHTFRFSAKDDEWAQCWMGRTGVPLTHFQDRWNQLPVHASSGTRSFLNQSPAVQVGGHHSTSLGGVYSATDPKAPEVYGGRTAKGGSRRWGSTSRSFRRRLQQDARELANSCPGDWNNGVNMPILGMLRRYAQGDPKGLEREEFVFNVVTFRLETANFINRMVYKYRLVRPYDQTVLKWDRQRWQHEHDLDCPRFNHIWDCMRSEGVRWHGTRSRGSYFGRSHGYLAAALFDSDLSDSEVETIVKGIASHMSYVKAEAASRVERHPSVRETARRWLGSVGRKIRDM